MSQQEVGGDGDFYREAGIEIRPLDVAECYEDWDTPTTIISDGAYGTGLFPNEPDETEDIPEWYEPHVRAWSERATPRTTLWFWNTELGWAEVHPILKEHGWTYCGCNIWNKGMGHIAGNSNTKRMRKFPQVTEVCVQYVRDAEFTSPNGENPVNAEKWSRNRSKFDLDAGVTNVWEEGQVNGSERVVDGTKARHTNQKPLRLMYRIIEATTDRGDVVWEPFGGLCTGAVAAKQLGRKYCAAERVADYYEIAVNRLRNTESESLPEPQQSKLLGYSEGAQ